MKLIFISLALLAILSVACGASLSTKEEINKRQSGDMGDQDDGGMDDGSQGGTDQNQGIDNGSGQDGGDPGQGIDDGNGQDQGGADPQGGDFNQVNTQTNFSPLPPRHQNIVEMSHAKAAMLEERARNRLSELGFI